MTPAMVSMTQVNRYLWHRQGFDLSQRWTRSAPRSAIVGLYGTGPSLYPTVLARYADFHFTDLDDALYEKRSLARWLGMRRSGFALPVVHLPVVFQAIRQRQQEALDKILAGAGVSPAEYARAADQICGVLEAGGLTAAEIKKALPHTPPHTLRAFAWVMSRLAADGKLARGRVRGGWKSDLTEYTLFEHWLPGVDLHAISPEQARSKLAGLYLQAFGPASLDDFHWWSGLSRQDAEQALRMLKRRLALIQIKGQPGIHYLLQKDIGELAAVQDAAPPGVSLLPVWDAYLMAYRERARYLADAWYDRVYDASGNAAPAVMIGGQVAGVWDTDAEGRRFDVKVALFKTAPRSVWRDLQTAAERLAREMASSEDVEVRLLRCPPPPSLKGASQNRFRFPLRGIRGERAG